MAKFFIDRPIFAIVISIFIVLGGGIAAFNLPIAQYPQIIPPTINVTASYAGASSEVVEQSLAQLVEEQVNGVEGMVSMSSTSSRVVLAWQSPRGVLRPQPRWSKSTT